ncbi:MULTISPECIES: hypothetical protein [unclassified Pseudomonas]|uniref:hypothetical protein n=1 Tax=unclassified Pseudomonas TaxID=196821 RepID=UPI0024486E4A|nr:MULTISPECIES: hypothetical protein [unclassified Pseudomonas]MDG9928254.1 hypothetical protein [Pseudomonas sp. GD04042]MDH0481182.1 hypothetical protein [Pseudomonas sp. GD04015]MDH0604518.1 hypothetical protein [Pseudomonas sp. GD03869]
MTVRYYHRDQTGAPSYTIGTSTIAVGWAAFKAIVKACLVSGYGAYPAAGWELIAEETNCLVLRNGPHSGYIGFSVQGENQSMRIFLLNSFTGIVSGVPTGAGRKTGTATGETVPHRWNLLYGAAQNANHSWSIFADEKTFLLQMCNDNSGTVTSLTGTTQSNCLYAGEDTAGNFIAMGGQNASSPSSSTGPFDSNGMTVLKDPVTGLLVDTGSISVHCPLDWNLSYELGRRLPLLPEINLTRTVWAKLGGPAAGYLRGIAQHPAFVRIYPGYIGEALGVPGLNSRNVNSTPIHLGDSNLYLLTAAGSGSSYGRFHTNNPAFW